MEINRGLVLNNQHSKEYRFFAKILLAVTWVINLIQSQKPRCKCFYGQNICSAVWWFHLLLPLKILKKKVNHLDSFQIITSHFFSSIFLKEDWFLFPHIKVNLTSIKLPKGMDYKVWFPFQNFEFFYSELDTSVFHLQVLRLSIPFMNYFDPAVFSRFWYWIWKELNWKQ